MITRCLNNYRNSYIFLKIFKDANVHSMLLGAL